MQNHYSIEWLLEKYTAGEKLKYLYFWGHTNKTKEPVGKFCFSQWSESPFTVDKIVYKTAEHWMMAQKALLFHDSSVFEQVIQSSKPGDAKALGRKVKNFNDELWNEHRYAIVVQGNIHKFGQNPIFGTYLQQTGEHVLVEASPVDAIWGIGLSIDSAHIHNVTQWRGLNLLGFALMEARDYLRDNIYQQR